MVRICDFVLSTTLMEKILSWCKSVTVNKYHSHVQKWLFSMALERAFFDAKYTYAFRTEVRIRHKYSNQAVYLFRVAARPEHMLSLPRIHRAMTLFLKLCFTFRSSENAQLLAQKSYVSCCCCWSFVATSDLWSRHSVFFAKTPFHGSICTIGKEFIEHSISSSSTHQKKNRLLFVIQSSTHHIYFFFNQSLIFIDAIDESKKKLSNKDIFQFGLNWSFSFFSLSLSVSLRDL